MNSELLLRIGEALYGDRWQSALAGALKVSGRRVRYWLAGTAIPKGVEDELLALLRARHAMIVRLIKLYDEESSDSSNASASFRNSRATT